MSHIDAIPPAATKRSCFALFVLTIVVLEAVTSLRMPRTWPAEWDQATAMVVTNSVARKVAQGMSAPMADSFEADLKHTVTWNGAQPDRHYLRQFGAGVFALAAFAPSEPDRLERYLMSARYVAAALSIVVTAAILALLARRCGIAMGIALLVFLSNDLRYLSFCSFLRSLYWLPGLSLLPLLVMLALYTPAAPPGRRRLTMLLFGGAVCLRALCGYEYISVPVLMSCAVILFRAADVSPKVLAGDCLKYVVCGGIGTALAIGIHAVSLYHAFGSWQAAYDNTLGNAIRRSFGEHELVRHVSNPAAHFRGILGTLRQNPPLSIVILLWFAALVAYALRVKRKKASPRSTFDLRLKSLALASLAGAVASASWLVLMRTHAALHPQYNSMAFYQGFIWFAIPFIVVFAVGAWKEFRSAGESGG